MVEWNCGNGIAEIGWKKKIAIGLWQCHCRNRGVKKKLAIVAIPLPKMGRKKIAVFKIWGGIKKKYYVHNMFTTFSQ